ncbi:MAG: PIN domain-containing protein [Burkholderiaceae bacterium]|nr:PIN domain-containing protein [Burkholderiaceae bacterium]
MKGHPLVRRRLERTPAANVLLSPVVLGELAFGARESAHVARNEARVAELAAAFQVPPMDARAGLHYGEVRARFERQGLPIGANDTGSLRMPWPWRRCSSPTTCANSPGCRRSWSRTGRSRGLDSSARPERRSPESRGHSPVSRTDSIACSHTGRARSKK